MSAAAMSQPPAQTARGVDVRLIPNRPPRRVDDGRVAVPMWVRRDGVLLGDTEMVLSPQEAEEFANRLRGTIATGGPR